MDWFDTDLHHEGVKFNIQFLSQETLPKQPASDLV